MNSKDFAIGTVIRAYDFEPRNNQKGSFIEGRIVAAGWVHRVGFKGYTIEIGNADRATDPRIGDIGYVPFDLSYGDFKGRITNQEDHAQTERFFSWKYSQLPK